MSFPDASSIIPTFLQKFGEDLQLKAYDITEDVSYNSWEHLANNWDFTYSGTRGTLWNNMYYASWWFEGRGPITAKGGGMLHWIDRASGQDVFAKSVGPFEGHEQEFMHSVESWIGSEADSILQSVLDSLGD